MPPCARARISIFNAFEPKPKNGTDQCFYPRDKLERILTRDLVFQVLNCACENCRHHKKDLRLVDEPSGFVDVILSSAISLFALLISIDAAPFVVCFLARQKNDRNISDFGEDLNVDIGEKYWSYFHRHWTEESQVIARNFWLHLFQFAVPTLTSERYHIFGERTILPFVEEYRIGRYEDDILVNEGAYGTVYRCRVWPAYNKLPNSRGTKWFARKELNVPTRLFSTEKRNLEMVNKLNDPHIVKIIKTYKHGSKNNIIFPLSKTNLRVYLREDQFVTPISPIKANPLWQQVLGVARALDRIINYDDTGSADNGDYYGFHFDLKPENILVENDGTLIISDFGQATFLKRGGSSRVSGHGGTEAYAPPEIDNLTRHQTRRYDIWSLGCVLVEILTVIVRGSRYLDALDKLRRTTSGNVTDDRFFEIDPTSMGPGRKYRVKGVIMDWIEELPRRVTSQNNSKDFVTKVVLLIKDMLAVDAGDRISSGTVVRRLANILRQNQERDNLNVELPQAGDGESTVGAAKLSEIELWYKTVATSEWQGAKLFIFQRFSVAGLRVVIQSYGERFTKCALREDLMLVPLYAFKMQDLAEEGLVFKGLTPSSAYCFEGDKFSFSTFEDVYTMQSVLTGQDVKISCRVEKKVDYKTRHDLFKKAIQNFPVSFNSRNLNRNENACVIQLWIETNFADQKPDNQLNHHTQGPRPPREPSQPKDIPLGRLAIFHYDRIVVIPLALNWTTDVDSNVADSKILQLEPRDASKDRYFSVATLNGTNDRGRENHCYPGIPLDTALLREQEQDNRFECSRVIIHFQDLQERNKFKEVVEEMRSELKKAGNRESRHR